MSWLPQPPAEPNPQGWDRVYAGPPQGLSRQYPPDAAALVLDPRVVCARTAEPVPLTDACTPDCVADCGVSPQWTHRGAR